MTKELFTVDAALLRELGERLVGRPHIALAELIKNAYDADARTVEILFEQGRITISDDGHGMSRDDFVGRWMRIGTTHKQHQRVSPELGRPFTGSKGVGRLASQLLGRRLSVVSVALRDPALEGRDARRRAGVRQLHRQIDAAIDWDTAVNRGDLTSVEVDVVDSPPAARFPGGSRCGTTFSLEGLTARWDAARFRRLAQEVWALQPPFRVDEDDEDAFVVSLESDRGVVVEEFMRQMAAILDIYTGRVRAVLRDDDPDAEVAFTFLPPLENMRDQDQEGDDDDDEDGDGEEDDEDGDGDGEEDGGDDEDDEDGHGEEDDEDADEAFQWPTRLLEVTVELRMPAPSLRTFSVRVPECRILSDLTYEVRAFDLRNRLPSNVKVDDARGYMSRFGGVHIYDAGFRLPYYGPDIDWLRIELDHARRLSRSALLPEALQVRNGLQDLPTNRRLYGGAAVSTAAEAAAAAEAGAPHSEALAIQVTRDRLVDNEAYQTLRGLVRLGVDAYATEVARAKVRARPIGPGGSSPAARPAASLSAALDALEQVKGRLPAEHYQTIVDHLTTAAESAVKLEDATKAYASVLGALATAGMTSLAYEHESAKQRAHIRETAKRLDAIARALPAGAAKAADELAAESKALRDWAVRSNRLAKLFRPLLDEESRETVAAFRARRLVDDVVKQLRVLARGTEVRTRDIPPDLRLAPAGHAAWSAVLQNLLVNAFNATLDCERRFVDIDGDGTGRRHWLRIQDTGAGVDLSKAGSLFEPFVRDMAADRHRAALGLGGSGLGLTIVRMITDEIRATVAFEEPDSEHSTSVRISWSPQ